MASIHEQLYNSADFQSVDFQTYLQTILQAVMRAFKRSNVLFNLQVAETFRLELTRAIPCGLILNEVITNIFKHAFPDSAQGQAEIKLSVTPSQDIFMQIADNGIGIPDQDWSQSNSLGMKIIHLLTEQLAGTIALDGHQGTTITIIFPLHPE